MTKTVTPINDIVKDVFESDKSAQAHYLIFEVLRAAKDLGEVCPDNTLTQLVYHWADCQGSTIDNESRVPRRQVIAELKRCQRAIDAIYSDGQRCRNAVIKYYGIRHQVILDAEET